MESRTITLMDDSCSGITGDHYHTFVIDSEIEPKIKEVLPISAKITSVVLRVRTYHNWTSILGGNANINLAAWFCSEGSSNYNSGTNLISSTRVTNDKTWATYSSGNLVGHFTTTYPFSINTSYPRLSIYYDTSNIVSRTYYHQVYLDIEYEIQQFYISTTVATAYGSVTGSGYYDYGSTAELKATPKTGYYLSNWKKKESDNSWPYLNTTDNPLRVTVTEDATYEPVFSAYTYEVNAIASPAEGGIVTGSNTYSYGSTAKFSAIANPGYTFKQWSNGSSDAILTVTVTGSATYTATFERLTYTISYNLDGGMVATANPTSYNVSTSSFTLVNPTKVGYTFIGWTGSNGTTPQTSVTINKGSTDNKSYTANWNANVYRATLDANGGTCSTSYIDATYNSTYGTLPTPTRAGYTFGGWFTNTSYATQILSTTKVTTTNAHTLYAKWTEHIYNIAFNSNTGSGSMPSITNIGYDDSVTLTANTFTKTEHTFNGWNTSADGSGTSYIDKASVSKLTPTNSATVILYAQWKINSYKITTVVSPSGSGVIAQTGNGTYDYGSSVTLTANPATGYRFVKWNEDNSTINPRVITVSENATYTAVFEKIKYTIIFKNYDGSELQKLTLEHGVIPTYTGLTPKKPQDAQNTYEFTGWSPSIGAVTSNIVYTAQFKANIRKYTVVWYNDDGTELERDYTEYGKMPTYDKDGGANPTKPSTPQYTYTFAGWHIEISVVKGDIEYYATYTETINTYTVTWKNYDGTVLETDEKVPYGDMPEYNGETPTRPSTVKYSYVFANCWDTEVVEVTKDVVYIAVFTETINKYLIEGTTDRGGTVTGGGVYEYGDSVTLIATPLPGYTFVKWHDGNTSNTRTVTVTGEASYLAIFMAQNIYRGANIFVNPYIGVSPRTAVYKGVTKIYEYIT